MLKIGRKETCKIYLGAVEHCKAYHGATQVYGCKTKPTVSPVTRDYRGGTYQFVVGDFTKDFNDPHNNSYKNVTIDTLPDVGTISYQGTPITAGFSFDLANIIQLTYAFDAGYTTDERGYWLDGVFYPKADIPLTFRTSNDSVDLDYSDTTSFAFIPREVGALPEVDDNQDYLSGKEYIFSETSFTKGFSDPDGDGYKNVRLTTLPEHGVLEYLSAPVEEGDIILATDSANLKYVLLDRYAIYEGVLYDFGRSLDTIVAEQESLGFFLTVNSAGQLKFLNGHGEVQTISGKVIEDGVTFGFTTSDNSASELMSEEATFTLTPQGDANIKENYTNTAPTVGDNEFNL
jgi:hypothetical protein